MTKYRVRLFVLQSVYFTIDASTEDAAVSAAKLKWNQGDEGYVDKWDMRIHDHDIEEMES